MASAGLDKTDILGNVTQLYDYMKSKVFCEAMLCAMQSPGIYDRQAMLHVVKIKHNMLSMHLGVHMCVHGFQDVRDECRCSYCCNARQDLCFTALTQV